VIQDFFSPEYVENEKANEEYEENDYYKNHPDKIHHGVRYRDPITEGYSVTPNFFIRGEMPKYEDSSQFKTLYFYSEKKEGKDSEDELFGLARKEGFDDKKKAEEAMMGEMWDLRNRHFKNRLFDRDTLLLQVYNVNFLYVLKAYTSKRTGLRDEFKAKARKMFRENFLKLLDEKYVFWAVWPKAEGGNREGLDNPEKVFVDKHFRTLVGKIFKPKDTGSS